MTAAATVVTVVGARPQFIKAAPVSRAFQARSDVREILIHTGQHYDAVMSDVFFAELGIAAPARNLEVGSGTHAEQTGQAMVRVEETLLELRPDFVLVYGDTNSTLAAALAAAKLHIPVAHVEAGMRSWNRAMPEETNRVLTDHVSSVLCVSTATAAKNLAREGITENVRVTGDVMYDAALLFGDMAEKTSSIVREHSLTAGQYVLATIHRAENTDDPSRLKGIVSALAALADSTTVVFPMHPRTRNALAHAGLESALARTTVLEPVGYLDMTALERNAAVILTDSGGIQKEACFHGVPCVTVRTETEWTETVESGWNVLVDDPSPENIAAAVASQRTSRPAERLNAYGDGHAAGRVVAAVMGHLGGRVDG